MQSNINKYETQKSECIKQIHHSWIIWCWCNIIHDCLFTVNCSFRWSASVMQLWSWWMRTKCVSLKIIPVMPTSSTVPMASVYRVSGLVMAPMTVGTILMKIGTTVVSIVSKSVLLYYFWGMAWKKTEYLHPIASSSVTSHIIYHIHMLTYWPCSSPAW